MVNLKNLNKWATTGLQANNSLSNFANNATNDPTGYLNNLMSSYRNSDIFNRKAQSTSDFFRNQMTARGLNGSNYSDEKLMQTINNLVDDDMQGYLNNSMNVLNSGLTGLNNLSSTGMQAESNAQNLQLQQDIFDEQQSDKNNWFTNFLKAGVGSGIENLFSVGNSWLKDAGNSWYGKKFPNSNIGLTNRYNQSLMNYGINNPQDIFGGNRNDLTNFFNNYFSKK